MPKICYRTNAQINHVNEWLQSQLSPASTATDLSLNKQNYSRTSSIHVDDVIVVDSKFSQTDRINNNTSEELAEENKQNEIVKLNHVSRIVDENDVMKKE